MPNFNKIQAEMVPQYPGLPGIEKKIEVTSKCYKDADKFDKDYCAEHASIYLYYVSGSTELNQADKDFISFYENNPYSKVKTHQGMYNYKVYVTTNYRVILENKRKNDLQYMCNPTTNHEQRYTLRIWTDRGVSTELNHHRINSYSEKSTEYKVCNEKGKINISNPSDFKDCDIQDALHLWSHEGGFRTMAYRMATNQADEWKELDYWLFALNAAEFSYWNLIRLGWPPQKASRVLPSSTQTELFITAYKSDWQKFLDYRYFDKKAQRLPDVKETALQIFNALKDTDVVDKYMKV